MNKASFFIISLSLVLLLAACGGKPENVIKLSHFTFTDQNGHPFGTENLEGKVWIADFIFTKCDTVCPPMTLEMAGLQKKFKEDGIEVDFVSFTVDPTIDSPKVLKTYISQFTDDESNWHLLTGYSQKEIELFARQKFQTIVQKPKASDQVIHGTNFYLIEPEGTILGEYNFVDDSYVTQLSKDIRKINRAR